MLVPTPHNNAKIGDIAKTVLMPGDPLRAKYIAEKYLENVVCYNEVREMFGFTGTYKGVRISIQGSGMGCPSMGIYSMELFNGYNVDNIIRVGSIGGLSDDVNLRDIIVAKYVLTDSNYPSVVVDDEYLPIASSILLQKLENLSKDFNVNLKIGKIYTSDFFYSELDYLKNLKHRGILGVEMETAALYANAKKTGKNAISLLTVSDKPLKGESLEASERQNTFDDMIKIALELAIKC